jgi:hypothetical protein
MQEIRLVQRNFSILNNEGQTVIPEKLFSFETRINKFLSDGWRLHSIISTSIEDCPIMLLVRDA